MTARTVYVILPGFDYEGYGAPIGVFDCKRAAIDAANAYDGYCDEVSVFETPINGGNGDLVWSARKD